MSFLIVIRPKKLQLTLRGARNRPQMRRAKNLPKSWTFFVLWRGNQTDSLQKRIRWWRMVWIWEQISENYFDVDGEFKAIVMGEMLSNFLSHVATVSRLSVIRNNNN